MFNILSKLWRHANLSMHRKLQFVSACIVTKVLCALESLWILKVVRQRIDAFQCFCLRKILRIAPSYVSRITNIVVLERSGQIPLSALLE